MEHNDDDAPLPKGWSRGYSKSQKRTFYFHTATKHTQWHFPTASEAKDPLKAKQRAQEFSERDESKKRAPPSSEEGGAGARAPSEAATAAKKAKPAVDDFLALADATSVAIIVPYRDIHATQKRAAHLARFVPHMVRFLGKLQREGLVSDYHIYIVEQSDDGYKFNRGKLLNVGFDYARKHHAKLQHDVFIFHDVDLLPQDDLGPWYAKFPVQPTHIARVWDRYSNNPK